MWRIAQSAADMLEKIGGAQPPVIDSEKHWWLKGVALGTWWYLLLMAVYCFVGRETKFIYIDF